MPQTMLALIAVVVTSIFSFNQQRASMHSGMARIYTEVQSHQLGVAAEVLEHAEALAFDEAAIGQGLVPAATMTAADALGADAGEAVFASFDDLDDLAGMRHTVTREMTDMETGETVELVFEVEAAVTYMAVGPDGQYHPTTTPTYQKSLEVEVRFPALDGSEVPVARIARMYSYRG